MTTTIRSWGAIALATFFVSVTCVVQFEDVIRGGTITIGHVTSLAALVAAIAAGHWFYPVLKQREHLAAFGLALVFAAATGYIVTTGAGRQALVTANKVAAAEQAAKPLADLEAELAEAKADWKKSKALADRECATGEGKLCRSARKTEGKDESHVRLLEARRASMAPVKVAVSEYHQFALMLSTITGRNADRIEASLKMLAPFLLVALCEICAIIFGNLGLGHREVPEPANDDLPLERTEDEVIDWCRAFEAKHGRQPQIPEVQQRFPAIPKTTAWRRVRAAASAA